MADVRVGEGNLAGKGVYADRHFSAGEPVIRFQLEHIDEAQYLALPAGEDLFVHSYSGRRYLYPPPARFVNHADDPSCVEDFDRCCDVAVRDIARGDPITIDANQETMRELTTYLDAYASALSSRSVVSLASLVDSEATLWGPGATAQGRDALVAVLLESPPVPMHGIEWLIGTGRWEVVCSASTVGGGRSQHITMLLKVIRGNWQLVYQHVG